MFKKNRILNKRKKNGKTQFSVSLNRVSNVWRRYQETGNYSTRAAQGFREPSTQQQDWYLLLSERYDVTSSQLLLQFLTKLSEMDCMRVACKPDVS